jgi:hypothetical protein
MIFIFYKASDILLVWVEGEADMTLNTNDNNSSPNHSNLDPEDRFNLVAGNMVNEIDKSFIEMLLGYHPQLNQKEMAVCLAMCYTIWDLKSTLHNAVVEYSMNVGREPSMRLGGKELFMTEKEVEDTIRQLIEKGVLKNKYSYTVNGLSIACRSPLCPKAFYHLVKMYHFVKEELESEAFMIVSV